MFVINKILFAYILTSLGIIGLIHMFGLNNEYTKLDLHEYDNFDVSNIGDSEEDYYYSYNYDEDAINVINL